MGRVRHIPFFISAVLLCIIVYSLYPFYQYYIDPDATSYLTIIRHYAEGDISRAVNGYWSPWSCWLAAAVLKEISLSIMAAAVMVNVAGAIAFLFITHSLLTFFKVQSRLVWLVDLTLAAFLSYAVYSQLCDDLWECFFLLSAMRIMLSDKFTTRPWLWAVTGVIGSLAYFAKAYAFPFFILNTICCTFFITEAWRKESRLLWFKVAAVCITVMLAGSFPWIWALHDKYGEWMTGTAGKLNLSWYTVGHPLYKEGITHLVPPPYPDSPWYWEDPYLVNGAAPNAFNSIAMWRQQLVRIPFNLLKMVNSMNQLSALFIPLALLILCIVFSQKVRSYFPGKIYILCVSFLLFPLAFILVNFEARYLWYMLPISMIVAAMALQYFFKNFNRGVKVVAVSIFVVSYLYWPVADMRQMHKVGTADHRLAIQLKRSGIAGGFTSNALAGREQQNMQRVAYFSGNPYYYIPYPNITHDQLLSEMRRYGVKYYFYLYNPVEGKNYTFTDENGVNFPEVFSGEAYGLRVFQLSP